jgi:hypothetical protein
MVLESDLFKARCALRRGALPGQPIATCACFQDAVTAKRCNHVCEDAVQWIAKAIAAERSEYYAIVIAASQQEKGTAEMKITDEIIKVALAEYFKIREEQSSDTDYPPRHSQEEWDAMAMRVALEAALRHSDSE